MISGSVLLESDVAVEALLRLLVVLLRVELFPIKLLPVEETWLF